MSKEIYYYLQWLIIICLLAATIGITLGTNEKTDAILSNLEACTKVVKDD